jgi:23S rRNA (adenine2030-N6)-methyltransferase
MLSYRHHFHAGNHADVLKHVALVALLRALTRKDKPLCFIDTHAGRGLYALRAAGGEPAPEWPDGIGRTLRAFTEEAVADAVTAWAAAVRTAIGHVHSENPERPSTDGHGDTPGLYPGSPALAAACLRASDRLLLSELHPGDAEALLAHFDADARVEAARRDGHAHARRCLPPRERRALMLIDPAYERREEINEVLTTVTTALARMATATIAVWYPLARGNGVDQLLRASPGTEDQALLHLQLRVRPADNPIGMNGSGLLIWNPPWQFDTAMEAALPWLSAQLDQGGGGWLLQWLRAPR